MSYFPESIMPSRIKQESADVDGNQYIFSATDFNRHDEEIRAIEKVIGVPRLPVPGGPTPDDDCSILSILVRIAEQLKKIRDDYVLTTSGVIAIKDTSVTVNPQIQFPSSWSTTNIATGFSGLIDTTIFDEDKLDTLDFIELDDVTGMPNEGYVTVINDETVAPAPIVHTSNLIFFSPPRVNGKVNRDFLYEVLISDPRAIVTVSATPLPGGLTLADGFISGTPITTGTTTITLKAASGAKSASLSLIITIFAEATPSITGTPLASVATAGVVYQFEIPIVGAPDSITATGIPGGLTLWGKTISGTPRRAETATINITVIDEFGDSATGVLNLSIGS